MDVLNDDKSKVVNLVQSRNISLILPVATQLLKYNLVIAVLFLNADAGTSNLQLLNVISVTPLGNVKSNNDSVNSLLVNVLVVSNAVSNWAFVIVVIFASYVTWSVTLVETAATVSVAVQWPPLYVALTGSIIPSETVTLLASVITVSPTFISNDAVIDVAFLLIVWLLSVGSIVQLSEVEDLSYETVYWVASYVIVTSTSVLIAVVLTVAVHLSLSLS